MTDMLVRTLRDLGYHVRFVSNITDVGHLTSDSDTGEDKMEKGAHREGKTAWDIVAFYTDAYLTDSKKLNLIEPDVQPRPTQLIKEQIAMVSTLVEKKYAYQIDDGIYFDTSKASLYGILTSQNREELKIGARVEVNPNKKHPHDFALWKFSPKGAKRDMEWDSPWGKGFPGWHIECSVMSMKYLGNQIDIHTGGADLIPIHHTNEIVQSEAASGKSPFSRFWVHGQFLLVNGEKMSKSKKNFYRLADIEAKGFSPLALRYFYFTAHYRAFLNFTWEALSAAQTALDELYATTSHLQHEKASFITKQETKKAFSYKMQFTNALKNDLNCPQALQVVWDTVKSDMNAAAIYNLLLDFDRILGFDLEEHATSMHSVEAIPPRIHELIQKREQLRRIKRFQEADHVRGEIEKNGFILKDTKDGPKVTKIKNFR